MNGLARFAADCRFVPRSSREKRADKPGAKTTRGETMRTRSSLFVALVTILTMVPATGAFAEDTGVAAGSPVTHASDPTSGELGESVDFSSRGTSIGGTLQSPRAMDYYVTASGQSCYWSQPSHTVNNQYGQISNSWYYIEWCGDGGVVSDVLTLWCDGAGSGGYTFQGCNINHGSTGFTSVHVGGTWNYRFGCCGGYLYHYSSVSADHAADGGQSGWWTSGQ